MIYIRIWYEEAQKAIDALEEYGVEVEFIDDGRLLVDGNSDFETVLLNEDIVWDYLE